MDFPAEKLWEWQNWFTVFFSAPSRNSNWTESENKSESKNQFFLQYPIDYVLQAYSASNFSYE